MKLSVHIAITAVGLMIASAGVLMPIKGSIAELEAEIQTLEDQVSSSVPLQVEIEVLRERLADIGETRESRTISLCPDTSAGAHEFESSLARIVRDAGLRRISMDRQNGVPVNGHPCFLIALRVEGTATQLHNLLESLEELAWVNRVTRIEVEKGQIVRKIDMSIAVMLEEEA